MSMFRSHCLHQYHNRHHYLCLLIEKQLVFLIPTIHYCSYNSQKHLHQRRHIVDQTPKNYFELHCTLHLLHHHTKSSHIAGDHVIIITECVVRQMVLHQQYQNHCYFTAIIPAHNCSMIDSTKLVMVRNFTCSCYSYGTEQDHHDY